MLEKEGEEISNENTMIVRPSPEGSLAPKEIYNILNKKANKEIKKGELIRIEDIE